jgi:hypothetical protein
MAPQKHTYSIILAAVSRLRDDLRWRPRLFNKWLPAETWVKAIEQARLINVDLHIDAAIFNRAMACEISTWRISMLDFKSTNSVFFQVMYKGYKYYYATEKATISRILSHWMPNGKRKQMKLVHMLSLYR